jgi:uncharacterized protein DUF2795
MTFAHMTGMKEMQASEVADQFIKGLEYPVSKKSIVAAAREASLGPTIQDALKKLPEREYSDAEDLTQALNAS